MDRNPGGMEGFGDVLRAMGKARTKDAIKIEDGLRKVGEMILKKADQYVPRATGFLAASGKVIVQGKGLGATVTVVYEAPYAVFVHEDLTKFHQPPTQAKWLQRAVRETRGNANKIMQREVVGASVAV